MVSFAFSNAFLRGMTSNSSTGFILSFPSFDGTPLENNSYPRSFFDTPLVLSSPGLFETVSAESSFNRASDDDVSDDLSESSKIDLFKLSLLVILFILPISARHFESSSFSIEFISFIAVSSDCDLRSVAFIVNISILLVESLCLFPKLFVEFLICSSFPILSLSPVISGFPVLCLRPIDFSQQEAEAEARFISTAYSRDLTRSCKVSALRWR
mmetsp:Transcript_7523/g.18506  ORF Transcript_7523/g.18506 Transcript_7523/m.18506 type:complete len:213 (+) Transcript_7523:1836-2474(+)